MSAAGSPIEIDWPLTVAWWTFGVTVATLILVWLSYRLQKSQHQAAPTGIEVDDTELFVLRLLDEQGPLWFSSYREPAAEGSSQIISAQCLEGSRQCVRTRHYAPGNSWFLEILVPLRRRGLLEAVPGARMQLTENGRAVVRKERGRVIKEEPALELLPMEGR